MSVGTGRPGLPLSPVWRGAREYTEHGLAGRPWVAETRYATLVLL